MIGIGEQGVYLVYISACTDIAKAHVTCVVKDWNNISARSQSSHVFQQKPSSSCNSNVHRVEVLNSSHDQPGSAAVTVDRLHLLVFNLCLFSEVPSSFCLATSDFVSLLSS